MSIDYVVHWTFIQFVLSSRAGSGSVVHWSDDNDDAQLYGLETSKRHHLCDEQGTFTRSRVLISTDLRFDQHVTWVSGQCFYQLRQLRSVRQSLDTESTTTLIRAFVSSRVDYCCSLLIGSPRSVTDKLQRVLNAAARVMALPWLHPGRDANPRPLKCLTALRL